MGDKEEALNSLNEREKEILRHLFEDPKFKVKDLAELINWSEGSIQTAKTAIFKKLGVPDSVVGEKKREWVVEHYREAFNNVFNRPVENPVEPINSPSEPERATPQPVNQPEVVNNTPLEFVDGKEPPKKKDTDIFTRVLAGLFIVFLLFSVLLFIGNTNLQNQVKESKQVASSISATASAYSATSEAKIEGLTQDYIPSTLPGPIMYANSFDSGMVFSDYVTGGAAPVMTDGILHLDGTVSDDDGKYFEIILGNEDWFNYIIYTRIIQQECNHQNERSSIDVRVRKGSGTSAFDWYNCEFRDKVMNVVITVLDGEIRLLVNGDDLKNSGHQTNRIVNEFWGGGVGFHIYSGSAIDYIVVFNLPGEAPNK
jgi:hypothetical protein